MSHELSLQELELQGADLLPYRTALQAINVADFDVEFGDQASVVVQEANAVSDEGNATAVNDADVTQTQTQTFDVDVAQTARNED